MNDLGRRVDDPTRRVVDTCADPLAKDRNAGETHQNDEREEKDVLDHRSSLLGRTHFLAGMMTIHGWTPSGDPLDKGGPYPRHRYISSPR